MAGRRDTQEQATAPGTPPARPTWETESDSADEREQVLVPKVRHPKVRAVRGARRR